MSTIMVPITTKVKEEEKEEFLQITESLGTSPSNAIRMFISAFNKRGGFPFDASNPYNFNQETHNTLRDVDEEKGLSKAFKTVEEMIADLDA